MIEEGLVTKLAGTTAVSALIAARLYPIHLPAECLLPAVTYRVSNSASVHSHGGRSGLITSRLQLTAHGRGYREAKQVAAALVAAIDYQVGAWGSTTVQSCIVEVDGADLGYIEATESWQITITAVAEHEE